ncbi:hypothetical protein [Paenibacillus radicis (ex Xue et al. 2023)]|uniref:Chemotaxis protein CheX n=1 Tax=Paenibacillus radicis (ex Xue et al. 2023) TaxID=2972489 RepID=A0ABT1YAW2_9BACL|nr:hypothetical protein [Paenibacillus radicis (ex Xue et al. 2023)]MCR8630042.1 hypothetical protein [Paenibacillus radicis (ex Xue et al. 2023)]
MFSQYFGHYLLEKGYINFAELEDVWEYQKKTHVKLGLLAINEGFMSAEQVERVHLQQTQRDMKFGEIAVEQGLLTELQLNKLLSSQKSNHLLLGQALVERNYMSLYQISTTLFQYKKDHGLSDERFSTIKNGDIRALVDSLLHNNEGVHRSIVVDYLTLLAKNVIRFIDPHVRLEIRDWLVPVSSYDWSTFQHIQGEINMYAYILSNQANWIDLAARYAQEPITEADEMAEASVGEFLNLHNGIFLVNMSDRGTELSLTPQIAQSSVSVEQSPSAVLVKVHYLDKSFDFILSTEPVHTGALSSAIGV